MRSAVLVSLVLAGCGASSATLAMSPQAVATRAYDVDVGSSGEGYTDHGRNPWVSTEHDRFSTFAADVDTASYTIARRKLQEGTLPPAASVRVEEWVNYFTYRFPAAVPGTPFSTVMDAAPHPFAAGRYVLRVGVATKAKPVSERKPAALVFLVDVSGSMDSDDKLGLAKRALHLLTNQLGPYDGVSIVAYAGSSRVVLPMTSIKQRERIHEAIEELSAGGSTAMGSGIDLAYEQAARWIRPGAISRVIVLSDGDANVGASSYQELLTLIDRRARQGVALSTIGVGMGNYKDTLMEQLADKGNGNSYYIDSFDAAKRVFADQLTSTIEVAAKDVKLQVELDPAVVARYRLVGYENRDVADQDFRKDAVTGGQVGWGHQVTAIYEVELTDAAKAHPSGLGIVHVRHKRPEADDATESAFEMAMPPAQSFDAAPADLRFAFAVAAFADVLRGGASYSLEAIRGYAAAAAGSDSDRRQLVALIDRACSLRGNQQQVAVERN
ncbi:MAG: von Willebrand factor type A domain-containing protein [Kofleriaceae bacterium]